MKLSELFLNRFLYRDTSQNLETKDSAFISADSSEAVPSSIPSGGAAQDINIGNVLINGGQLEPGTFPQTVLDVSNWGWGQTCVFSSTDLNTVSWAAGTFKSADGTTYSISAGNTGNMAAKTYIYLSLLDSTTAYQITTTPATAVGVGKVLVAVANPDTATATYNLSEATQIVGDNILANSINASKITTGQLVVGTNVGIGSAFPSASAGDLAYEDLVSASLLDSTVIVGGYIRTSLLTANNIQTGTLSSILIQTSTSANTGIKMSSALGGIVIYDQSLYIKNSNNSLIGYLYANYDATPTNDGSEWRLGLVNESGIDTFIGASKNIILSSQFVVPYADNTVYLGGSTTNEGGGCANDWTWKYIGGQIIDAKDKYQILGIDCIDISGTGVYFKGDGEVYLQGNGTDSDIKTTSSRIDLYHDTYTTGSNIMSGSVYLNSTTTQTDNGWRLAASGGNLLIQKSVSGSWVTKSTIAG